MTEDEEDRESFELFNPEISKQNISKKGWDFTLNKEDKS